MSVTLCFDDGYREVFERALPIFKEHRVPGVAAINTAWLGDYVIDTAPSKPRRALGEAMSWEMVKELYKEGWEIASHTHSHAWLPEKPLDFIECELDISQKLLEKFDVSSLCYPFNRGGTIPTIRTLVQKFYERARSGLDEGVEGDRWNLLAKFYDGTPLNPEKWQILIWHGAVENELHRVLQEAEDKGIRVVTLKEALP